MDAWHAEERRVKTSRVRFFKETSSPQAADVVRLDQVIRPQRLPTQQPLRPGPNDRTTASRMLQAAGFVAGKGHSGWTGGTHMVCSVRGLWTALSSPNAAARVHKHRCKEQQQPVNAVVFKCCERRADGLCLGRCGSVLAGLHTNSL
jgi:hypothetical protein